MDIVKYILVLVVFFVDSDAGGHGEKHHDHVKLHVPKFIHHDHHTKVVTIHHHHHKPKKEHHHHHHHHKPHIQHRPPPYQHTHHRSKSSSRTLSKGHTSQQKNHHHGLSEHHGHENKHHDQAISYYPPSVHNEPPTVNYAPPSINYDPTPSINYGPSPPVIYDPSPSTNFDPSPTYGSHYGSFLPSVPNSQGAPRVQGIVHTVKQVKVFDSLPGALPGNTKAVNGYEVTEQKDDDDDDVFTSVDSLAQSYPGTYGFTRNAAPDQTNYPFSDVPQLNGIQPHNVDLFSGAQSQPAYSNLEDFTIISNPPSAPSLANAQPSSISQTIEYDDPVNSVLSNDINSTPFLSFPEDDTPVIFSREAGLQQAVNSEGVETIAY